MSEISANIVVQPFDINFTVQQSTITVTPEALDLQFYLGGIGVPGGNFSTVQYNAGGVLGGIPNATWTGSKLSLGSTSDITISGGSNGYALVTNGSGNLSWQSIDTTIFANYANFAGEVTNSAQPNITSFGTLTGLNVNGISNLGPVGNVVITGGTNGYVLQTDGAGNLNWVAGVRNVTGTGVPGGAINQIQYNKDGANFGGSTGFSFNPTSNLVSMPGNLSVTSNVSAGNVAATNVTGTTVTGTLTTAAQPNITSVGNLTALTVVGNSTLGNIANVKISGGSNGQYLTTDGNSNLTFTSINTGTSWTNTANIATGDIFLGTLVNNSNVVEPGSTVNASAAVPLTSWTVSNIGLPIAHGVKYTGDNFWIHGGNGSVFSNTVYYSLRGTGWNPVVTPFATQLPEKGANNFVVIRQGNTNQAAYSNNLTSWTTTSMPATRSWNDVAYGNGTFVAINTEINSNTFAISTNDGVTWASKTVPSTTAGSITYGNGVFLYTRSNGTSLTSSDNGNTWTTGPSGFTGVQATVFGENKFMIVSTGSPTFPNQGYFKIFHSGNFALAGNGYVPVYPGGATYANGYFIVTGTGGGNNASRIAYTSNDGANWTLANTPGVVGPAIAYSSAQNILMMTNEDVPGNTTQIQISANPTILISDTSGDTVNANVAPTGTYKNLGSSGPNAAAMWTRTA